MINKYFKNKSTVYTDDFSIYNYLNQHPQVEYYYSVNHSQKEYAYGRNHMINAENRYSIIKPYLNIFRGVSKKNLAKYLIIIQYVINYKRLTIKIIKNYNQIMNQ